MKPSNVSKAPNPNAAVQKKNVDLLDLEEEPQPQPQVAVGSRNNDLFKAMNEKSKKSLPFASPLEKIDLPKFETLWESMPTELIENFQSFNLLI